MEVERIENVMSMEDISWQEDSDHITVTTDDQVYIKHDITAAMSIIIINTSGKNHFHEMSGDVGMAGWK